MTLCKRELVDRVVLTSLRSYQRLIEKLLAKQNASPNSNHVLLTFQCLAGAQRMLKHFEVQDAVTFGENSTSITDRNRVHESVLDRCKPLVERSNDAVRFVHGSVKE